jgi:HSP20 family protein
MATNTETGLEKRSPREPARGTEHPWSARYYSPSVDIVETRDDLLLHADMPGVHAGDIDIRFENGELSIHGKTTGRRAENLNFLLREYELGDFYRTFAISEAIDTEKIAAEFKDGVLVLRLPKIEKAKPRKIAVKT